MRAAPDGYRCLDGPRVDSQLPKLPHKNSRDRRRAERKYFVEQTLVLADGSPLTIRRFDDHWNATFAPTQEL
jgi:hypothetical protein